MGQGHAEAKGHAPPSPQLEEELHRYEPGLYINVATKEVIEIDGPGLTTRALLAPLPPPPHGGEKKERESWMRVRMSCQCTDKP